MITIRLAGGLGNQLFQLALGTQFEFQGRSVCYDVSSFAGDRARRYVLGDLGFNLPLTSDNAPVTYQEKSLCFDPEVLKIKSGVLNGYWQNEKYFASVHDYIRSQFVSRMHLSEKTKEIALEISNLATSSCFVHLRRSDNCDQYHKNGPYDGLGSLSVPYYQKAGALMREKGVRHWFLFTDDAKFAHAEYKSRENFRIVDHNGPGFTEDSQHILRKNNEGREVEDIYLMSLCHNAIVANSSFSWWGAWLHRPQENRVVTVPDPWYATNEFGPTEIIPERWTKVSVR